MNIKSKLKLLIAEKKIEINAVFAKECQDPTSDEYEMLQGVRQDYPTFKVQIRKIKSNPNKETYPGLTYEYMRDYITLTSAPEDEVAALAEFEHLLLVAKCQSKSRRYPIMKQWFLAKYPEVKEFGLAVVVAAAEKRRAATLAEIAS